MVSDYEFNLATLKGTLDYIHHVAMYIKINFKKEQQVKTVQAQLNSYTIVCDDYVYKMCDFKTNDVASYFQEHLLYYQYLLDYQNKYNKEVISSTLITSLRFL